MNKLKIKNIVIPLDDKLINKYSNKDEIFIKEKVKYKIIIINNIIELKNINLDTLKIEELKRLAIKIFNNYHLNNTFINNENNIVVFGTGIRESIEKTYYNRTQREYLKEHLLVFSKLGKIIESSELVSQVIEKKNRKKYIHWNYYLNGIVINRKKYAIEIEVVSLDSGFNQFHLERLKIQKKKTSERDGDAS